MTEIERLEQLNKTLTSALNIATDNLEKLTLENSELKKGTSSENFEIYWRMTYAGQAMQSFLSRLSIDDSIDYDFVAKESFDAAKAMINGYKT